MVTSDLWYLWKDPNCIHFSNRNLKRSETVHSSGAAALALALRLTPQEVTFQFGSQKEAPAAHPKSMFWFSTKLSMIVLGASDSFEDFHCNQQPINSQKPVPFLCLVQLMGGKKKSGPLATDWRWSWCRRPRTPPTGIDPHIIQWEVLKRSHEITNGVFLSHLDRWGTNQHYL